MREVGGIYMSKKGQMTYSVMESLLCGKTNWALFPPPAGFARGFSRAASVDPSHA